jgi:hypothetical protein
MLNPFLVAVNLFVISDTYTKCNFECLTITTQIFWLKFTFTLNFKGVEGKLAKNFAKKLQLFLRKYVKMMISGS